jgi:hypothetical protein
MPTEHLGFRGGSPSLGPPVFILSLGSSLAADSGKSTQPNLIAMTLAEILSL